MKEDETKALKAKIEELIEHGNSLLKQNMELIDRLKDIETGRVIKLPSQCTPNMYNNILGWLKEQKANFETVVNKDLPDNI